MEEVYIKQPKGFKDREQLKKVWRLLKSFYGLKQVPFKWNQAIDSHLCANSFELIEADPCIYVKRVNGQVVFIILYLDDCTIMGHSNLIVDVKQTLCEKCTMKDLGEAKSLLGAEILHDPANKTISLWQWGCIKGILWDFRMENCAKAVTPIIPGQQLPKLKDMPEEALNLPNRSIVGKLAFLSHMARPDISFAVHELSHHLNAWNEDHWKATKRVLHYLQGMLNYAIMYEGKYYDKG
jgi:hypothetical protein